MMSHSGLSRRDVLQKISEGKQNIRPASSSKSVWEIVRDNVFTYFNLLHLILFLCLFLVGEYKNSLFFVIILANAVIGIVQELRAKNVVDSLSLLSAPSVRVVREGREETLPPHELVEGDTVIFCRGDPICADAHVIDGTVDVNESLLTGEADDIVKRAGDTVLSGSYVTAGQCVAVLDHVGHDSFAYRLAAEAKKTKAVNSGLLRDLNRLLRMMGAVLLPLGILLFLKQMLFLHSPLNDSVVATAAAMIGMIPSGLYLLTSVALAVGVIRLGQKKTLVQEMYAMESLARADVLCLDKTGTLTTGELHVADAVFWTDSEEALTALANVLSVQEDCGATSRALKMFADRPARFSVCGAVPFSSRRKWSGAAFREGAFVLGACDFLWKKGEYPDVFDACEAWAKEGKRVLALARCKELTSNSFSEAIPLALFALQDELRAGVEKTVRFFEENGVSLRVISGDNAATVSSIAMRAGVSGAEKAIDLTDVKNGDLAELSRRYTVFGRATPEQKKYLIAALRSDGHTVAMTGDGVNDVLALKEADCGIAVAGGSDITSQVAGVVLMDGDWTTMKDVVMEGRRVINNIERSASLFLVKTMYSFGLSVLLLFLPFVYPYESVQLSLISVMTVGVPAFLIALEDNRKRVSSGFLQKVLFRAAPSGVSVIVAVLTLMILGWRGFLPVAEISTAAVLVTLAIGFLTLGKTCVPFSRWRAVVWIGCFVATIPFLLLLPEFFSLIPLSAAGIQSSCGAFVLAAVVMFLLDRLCRKIAPKMTEKGK